MTRGRKLALVGMVGGIVATAVAAPLLIDAIFIEAAQSPLLSLLIALLYLGIVASILVAFFRIVPRVGRILMSAGTILSGVLFLAVIAAFVHSYYVYTSAWWRDILPLPATRDIRVASFQGAASIRIHFVPEAAAVLPLLRPTGPAWMFMPAASMRTSPLHRGPSFLNRMGFSLNWLSSPSGAYEFQVIFPWWLAALVFLVLPAGWGPLWVRRIRRERQKRRPGFCPECGYDLRASPVRCPECGRPIDTTSGSAGVSAPGNDT